MMVINMVLWNIQLNQLLVEDGLSLFKYIDFVYNDITLCTLKC